MSIDSPVRRIQRVRHELKLRDVDVVKVDAISPGFRSVTFAGDSLGDFASAGFDDHVKFMLDTDSESPVRRDYTPRRFDAQARELTIEFALHGDGPAARWAAEAEAGQRVTIGGPRGSFVVPTDFAWHLLAGDDTAVPAIARRLEELPAGVRAFVFVHLDDPLDRRRFESAADLDVRWVDRADALIEAIRAWPIPAGEGYAWCAGEASTMATLRRVIVDEKGHDRHAIRAAAYWKRGASGHHHNIED